MRLTFEPLGKYVRLVDERNTNMVTESVLGINIDKYFMPSVANVIGTDLCNYKLLRKGRFACNPMHVGRDGRLPVSRYMEDVPAIVSPAYFMFEIIDENEIEPEYLMLCFRRPDFDRMCWFRTDASVRGGITWEDVCALTIPVPPITEQRKIVWEYQIITKRIALLQKMNSLHEELIKTLYRKAKAASEDKRRTIKVSDFCKVFTGKKDVNQAVANGKNRFYSCSPTPARSNDAIYEGRAILVAGNGSYTGRTTFVDEAFDLYQRTYALTPINKNCIELFLIYAALQTDFQEQIESKLHGSAIPYIVFGDLADFSFEIDGEYQLIGDNIKTLVYMTIKNDLEIEQLSSLTSLMLSSLASSDKNEVRK